MLYLFDPIVSISLWEEIEEDMKAHSFFKAFFKN